MQVVDEDSIYLSLDFFVVRALTFFGLGLLDFADLWPFRPWSGFVVCWNACSFVRLGWVPVMFGLLPRSPPWFIFFAPLPRLFSFQASTSEQLEGQYFSASGDL